MKDFFVECSSEDFMVCKSTKYAIMSPANWIAGEVGNYVAIGRGVPEGGGGGGGLGGGDVPPASPNPDPILDQHMLLFTPVFRPGFYDKKLCHH